MLLLATTLPLAAAGSDDAPLLFRHYDMADGLPSATIHDVLQDRTGFLWLATHDGLARFDGHELRVWRHQPRRPDSLAADDVEALLEDSSGRLWVATDGGGLDLFDRAADRFVHYPLVPAAGADVDGSAATALLETSDGAMWVGTDDRGVCVLQPAATRFTCLGHREDDPTSLSSDGVASLAETGDGVLWIATFDAGLNRFDPASGAFPQLRHDPSDPTSLASDALNVVHADRHGELWVGTYGAGVDRIDPTRGVVLQHFAPSPGDPDSLSARGVTTIAEDAAGRLWLGTWSGGLERFDRPRGRFLHSRHDPDDPGSLADDRVRAIEFDQLGQVWVGTQAGLDVHDPATAVFRRLRHVPGDRHSLAADYIQSVLEDSRGRLWVGTYNNGLSLRARPDGGFRTFAADPEDPDALANPGIWHLAEDAAGTVWVATSRGVHRYDEARDAFVRLQHDQRDPAPFSSNNILSLVVDDDGVLWLGTWDTGLDRYDPATGTCRHFTPDPDDPMALPGTGVWSLLLDRAGDLWVGTIEGGLARLDRTSGRFRRYVHTEGDPGGLSGAGVYSLLEDSRGRLWVGTDGGLDLFRPESGTFAHVPDASGGYRVASLVEDDHGRLWLGTGRGLARLDPDRLELTWFDHADGLPGDVFTTGAVCRGADGTLYFGSNHGLAAFRPDQVTRHDHVPPVVLTRFLLRNRPAAVGGSSPLTRDIGLMRHIVLSHHDYSFGFEFAALNLRQPEKNRYAYRLEGVEPEWVETDARYRRATYTGLSPGTYTFRVRGSNDDGVWNQAGAAVEVAILPPWWGTTWARGGLLLAAVLVIGGTVRWRTVALARRTHQLERLVAERTAELAESNRRLEEISLTDALTGLHNRRFLARSIADDVHLVLRDRDSRRLAGPLADDSDLVFCLIDLDRFKSINDSRGHEAGDAVLRQTAAVLRTVCRASDFIIRWGGEEFLVVGRFTSRSGAMDTAERIRQAIAARRFEVGGGVSLRCTCSVGAAAFPFCPDEPSALSWEQTLAVADRALYAAKQAGRNLAVEIAAATHCDPATVIAELTGELADLVTAGHVTLASSPRRINPPRSRRDEG